METMASALPMAKLEKQLGSAPTRLDRDQFAVSNVIFLIMIHVGALLSAWRASWAVCPIGLVPSQRLAGEFRWSRIWLQKFPC